MTKPLAIDLYCGLGGWTEGLLATGWDVIGFDIEQHAYDGERYPAQLVIQDVLTLHGSQFRTADLIVASPPCQAYSYMAMPWTRAKAKAAAIRADTTGEELRRLTALFDACFRIQREACEAAGRHIPMVVENVKGAQPWVGRARTSFGSYFLWGDVPALMPIQKYHQRLKVSAGEQWNVNRKNYTGSLGWDEGLKNTGGSWFNIGSPGQKETGRNSVHSYVAEGQKAPAGTRWFNDGPRTPDSLASSSSSSSRRKAASAKIAKIPRALSEWIGRIYFPREREAA